MPSSSKERLPLRDKENLDLAIGRVLEITLGGGEPYRLTNEQNETRNW